MTDLKDEAPRGLNGHQLAVTQEAARRVMATSHSPKITADSPGPKLYRALQTLRKYSLISDT